MQACGQGAPSSVQERSGDYKVPSRSPKRQLTVSPFRIAGLQVLTETHQDTRWHFPPLCGEGSRCSDSSGSLEGQTPAAGTGTVVLRALVLRTALPAMGS